MKTFAHLVVFIFILLGHRSPSTRAFDAEHLCSKMAKQEVVRLKAFFLLGESVYLIDDQNHLYIGHKVLVENAIFKVRLPPTFQKIQFRDWTSGNFVEVGRLSPFNFIKKYHQSLQDVDVWLIVDRNTQVPSLVSLDVTNWALTFLADAKLWSLEKVLPIERHQHSYYLNDNHKEGYYGQVESTKEKKTSVYAVHDYYDQVHKLFANQEVRVLSQAELHQVNEEMQPKVKTSIAYNPRYGFTISNRIYAFDQDKQLLIVLDERKIVTKFTLENYLICTEKEATVTFGVLTTKRKSDRRKSARLQDKEEATLLPQKSFAIIIVIWVVALILSLLLIAYFAVKNKRKRKLKKRLKRAQRLRPVPDDDDNEDNNSVEVSLPRKSALRQHSTSVKLASPSYRPTTVQSIERAMSARRQ